MGLKRRHRGSWGALLLTAAVLWLGGCDADEGSQCVDDPDCPAGQRCVLGKCEDRGVVGCKTDANCSGGQVCVSGVCSGGADGGGDSVPDGVVVVQCTDAAVPPLSGELIFNEILTAPRSGVDDTNCDGTVDAAQDEFIELVNDSDKQLLLDGIELQVNGTTKHTLSGCLDAGRGMVIYGGGSVACTGLGSRAEVSSKSFQLSNSGTSVALVSGGSPLDQVNIPSLGSSNASWVRVPDYSGAEFARHDSVVEDRHSPGRCTGGGDLVRGCMPEGEIPVGCMAPSPMAGELRINEVHSAPSGDDTNCDGVAESRQDEFVEIVNSSSMQLSLEGVVLQVNGNTKHTFDGCLDAGRGLVLYAGGAARCTNLGGTQAFVSDSQLSLANSGTTVGLALGEEVLDQVAVPSLSGKSYTRSPDFTGDFVVHDTVSSERFSVGRCTNGAELLPGCNMTIPGDMSTDMDVVSDTIDPGDTISDTMEPDVPPPCDPPGLDDLVLNEVLYSPASVAIGGGDANCDGEQGGNNQHDEFVEIVNVGLDDVLLRGVSITFNGETRYTFTEDICLMPSQAALVFGGGNPSCPAFDGAVVRVSSLRMTNSSGSVSVLNANGQPFTLGEVSWSSDLRYSLQRSPELTGSQFVSHAEVVPDGPRQSPGTCADGSDFSTGCQD